MLIKSYKFLIIVASIVSTCCTVYQPSPYVPYNYYNYPPPNSSNGINGPTSLRCIDNSNIYVHCNNAWWWAGAERGWIPTGGGWYAWPRQIWPDAVYDLYTPQQLNGKPIPILPYPY